MSRHKNGINCCEITVERPQSCYGVVAKLLLKCNDPSVMPMAFHI